MPPKAPKPQKTAQELEQKHRNAVKLETTVNGLLHVGAVGRAQRVFDSDWRDALLADLPLRAAFILDRPDRNGIHLLMDLVEEGKSFRLQLMHGADPRSRGSVAVCVAGQEAIIGWLPEDALEILRETGLKLDPDSELLSGLPKKRPERIRALAKQLGLGKSEVEKMSQREFDLSLGDLSVYQLKALVELLEEMLLAENAGVVVEFKRLLGGGTYADLYEPKILAIRGLQSGRVEFEMELVRPDFHHCPACDRIHTGEQDKCEQCLADGKRKKPRKEAVAEVPAVPVAQAFHNINEAKHKAQD